MLSFLKRLRVHILLALNPTKVEGRSFTFGRGTTFNAPHGIKIGKNVYIGKYCSLETDIEIGDHVLIANHCGLIGRYDHDYTVVGVSMKDAPWIGDPNYSFKGRGLKIVIESDCWIGFGSIILSGVTIGRGSLVAAGSIVTSDLPPYSISAGVPAKVVGTRFSAEQIVQHEAMLYGGPYS